jgi:ribosomal protein L13E
MDTATIRANDRIRTGRGWFTVTEHTQHGIRADHPRRHRPTWDDCQQDPPR